MSDVPRTYRQPGVVGVAAAAIAVVLVFCVGCQTRCGGSEPGTDRSTPSWPLDSEFRRRIPAEARAATFLRDLRDVRRLATFIRETLRPTTGDATSTPSEAGPGLAFDPELLDFGALGLRPEDGAALFLREGRLGAVLRIEDERTFRKGLDTLASDGTLRVRRREGSAVHQIESPAAPKRALQFRVADDLLLVRSAPRTTPRDPSETRSLGERFDAFFGDDHSTWPTGSRKGELFASVAGRDARAAGIVEPGRWLDGVATDPQARVIMSRLSNQLGSTAFRVAFDGETRTATLDLRGLSSAGEPVVVDRLGTATGELPPLGGLVEPGVLGVLHLSVDPKAVYRLLESSLPAARREQLDVFWEHARQRLQFRGPDAILENLTGHAVFVFYGLESERLSGPPAETLRNLFELRATREAILLPIKSRKRVERLLDKLTQMTKGQLSRQRSEHSVEYAWFDGGQLEWALILQDEHVLFVDSATSNAKAEQYERRGRALSRSKLREMHLAPLLADGDRSGLFVDTGTLGNLLRQNGYERAAHWLGPVQSMVLTTGMDGEVSHTRIDLRIDAP